jgi:DNA-binding response OmpR family regulator
MKKLPCPCQKNISLTDIEFEIIEVLLANQGTLVTRTQLLNTIWPHRPHKLLATDANHLEAHMRNIRRKLSPHRGFYRLMTVYGWGYRLKVGPK